MKITIEVTTQQWDQKLLNSDNPLDDIGEPNMGALKWFQYKKDKSAPLCDFVDDNLRT